MPRERFALLLFAFGAIPSFVHAQPTARGLGSVFHPLQLPDGALAEQAKAIPQEQKDRVHFFLINGLNPGYSANLNGAAAYYRSIGFTNTTCLQMPAAAKLRRQIETIRAGDPNARIVLLGYSWGANIVRSLANGWERDGIKIDTIVYLGGDTVFNGKSSRPGNVGRVLNITANGFLLTGGNLTFKGEDIDGATNHRINIPHLSLPSNREAIELVGKELIVLAQQSKMPSAVTKGEPPAQTAPPPIQTAPHPTTTDERPAQTVPALPLSRLGRPTESPLRVP